ncbi:hypothetical protein PBY51_001087 [Eleginops maclovinus]|uniref:Uncharacterized protein n=1 Tax=Eleginops maclovinus TaxID=56733 RepID=A0AAN7XP32_ELEMC|nr:hypothetical protein PBY51_001087 [Eleginops maclovinus]
MNRNPSITSPSSLFGPNKEGGGQRSRLADSRGTCESGEMKEKKMGDEEEDQLPVVVSCPVTLSASDSRCQSESLQTTLPQVHLFL